ncbi:hypothetical protein C5167_029470 [Papaver somniferum]|uniref:wall-associated receptor kinase-like 1 n=1 Tax=Papaver somniferum TaxID=3469 RepID=UPI000E6F9116|nr:wall-associated receptor kinase-like 1 [Papaver somniferum]RZC93828.1 hypothetical protein C5167_029470 [Papaver somniferum]
MVFYALEAEVAATSRALNSASTVARTISNGTSSQLAQPYCRGRCGNVSIPYPFGVDDPTCYRPRFEITCNDSVSPPVASFISRNGAYETRSYEVSELTLDYIRINVPVPAICDHDNITTATSKLIDPRSGWSEPILHKTPFTISNTLNRLAVLGCNIFGFVLPLNDGITNFTSSGCASRCDVRTGYVDIPNPCESGNGCCKVTVPRGLSEFKIQTTSTSDPVQVNLNHQNLCIRAFLVDKEFSGVDDLITSRDDSVVPVILDWAVPDFPTCREARRNPVEYACGANTECFDPYNGFGYRCKCAKGYGGNPYLKYGCQDVDECKGPNKCGREALCINTPGSYRCGCPHGKILEFSKLAGYQCRRDKRKFLIALYLTPGIGGSIVIVLMLGHGYWLYVGCKKRKKKKLKKKHFTRNGGLLLNQKINSNDGRVEKAAKIFVTKELERMTDNFNPSRIIGKGGCGTVYKGMSSGGETIAIKKSKLVDECQVEQFINEVVILSQINHRHIVKLLGCCLETEVPLLVYEFVPNGTLSYHLHLEEGDDRPLLSWKDRVRVASEIAGALAYLHSDASMPIFHRDIKSTNILLDKQYKAKVSDFGISRSVPIDKTHLTTLVQGTFGYLDPEYFSTCQFTDKSDVYSFGIVLVELLTGEKAISEIRHESEKGLAFYFLKLMEENRLSEILDVRVYNEGYRADVYVVAKLAKRCLESVGKKRPTMKEVSLSLSGLHEKLSKCPIRSSYKIMIDGEIDKIERSRI